MPRIARTIPQFQAGLFRVCSIHASLRVNFLFSRLFLMGSKIWQSSRFPRTGKQMSKSPFWHFFRCAPGVGPFICSKFLQLVRGPWSITPWFPQVIRGIATVFQATKQNSEAFAAPIVTAQNFRCSFITPRNPHWFLALYTFDSIVQLTLPFSYPQALALVATGAIDVKPLITHRFTLEQADKAFQTAADSKQKAIKVMINC